MPCRSRVDVEIVPYLRTRFCTTATFVPAMSSNEATYRRSALRLIAGGGLFRPQPPRRRPKTVRYAPRGISECWDNLYTLSPLEIGIARRVPSGSKGLVGEEVEIDGGPIQFVGKAPSHRKA